jgi:hypothetical protein
LPPFWGKIVYNDGTVQTGTVLWHRQENLILVFDQCSLYSFNPNQARELTLQDAHFGTKRIFLNAKNLNVNMPIAKGLAEVVGTSPDLSVISVNPGIYISPGAMVAVRQVLENTASAQAYTLEDGPNYRQSLFRIFRSFCKHHGNASGAACETLFLVDNAGRAEARKITLGFAIRQALSERKRRPLLRAVLAREGSKTRTRCIAHFLQAVNPKSPPSEAVALGR